MITTRSFAGLVAVVSCGLAMAVSPNPAGATAAAHHSVHQVTKSRSVQRVYIDKGKTSVQDKRTVHVTVSDTSDLRSLQQISVKWSGAHPTGGIAADTTFASDGDISADAAHANALVNVRRNADGSTTSEITERDGLGHTVAHSITLALATLGYAHLAGPPLNAAIAFSILILGVEIVRSRSGERTNTIRHPWIVAFAFGLLHGFGFASGLIALGVPAADIPLALAKFNVGV